MALNQYRVQIGRCFVEKRVPMPEATKYGKPVFKRVVVPVTVRRLFLFGEFVTTRQFRCVLVVRRGSVSYSVSSLAVPKKAVWTMPQLRPEPEPTWKRWASMNEPEFVVWLSRVLGPDSAMQALGELKAELPAHIS